MMLADGIENDTYNSDVLILKALFLLLQGMTAGHAGELHRAYLYQAFTGAMLPLY